jgi:hypothetical protein
MFVDGGDYLKISISAKLFAPVTERRNIFYARNMFSDESFDAIGFPSCWKTERYSFDIHQYFEL